MLEGFKLLARRNDVPCQSLVKVFLSERIESELRKHMPQKIKSQSARGRHCLPQGVTNRQRERLEVSSLRGSLT